MCGTMFLNNFIRAKNIIHSSCVMGCIIYYFVLKIVATCCLIIVINNNQIKDGKKQLDYFELFNAHNNNIYIHTHTHLYDASPFFIVDKTWLIIHRLAVYHTLMRCFFFQL